MAVAKKKKRKPAPRPKTLAQLQMQEAARIAAQTINPQKLAITQAVADAEAQRVMAARATEGITRALAEMSAGDAGAVRDVYAGAADRVGQLSAGLSGHLAELQRGATAGQADLIRTMAAPGTVTPGAEANANVSHFLGGVIPAEGLSAAAVTGLRTTLDRRAAGGARLADDFGATDFKAKQGIEDLRSKILEVESKRPGVLLEALESIKQRYNAERATNVQIGYLQLQQAKTVQEQAVAMTNMTGTLHRVKNGRVVDTGRPAPGSEAGQIAARNANDAADRRARARENAADRRARAAEQAADRANARAIAEMNNRAKAQTKNVTRGNNRIQLAKTRLDAEQSFRTEGLNYAQKLAGYNEDLGRPLKMPPRRVALMNAIFNAYGPPLIGKFGFTEAMIRRWASDIVMSFPNAWWQPSSYSRKKGGSGGVTA